MTIQEKYLKRARFWSAILRHCPGVRAIFLSGSLAQGHATKKSDIDFFIITRHGQIWTARFFIFVVLKIFRRIATESNHSGKICPNHFISDIDLEIREQDKYAANLFSCNQPLYDINDYWTRFMLANKNWIQRCNYSFRHPHNPDKIKVNSQYDKRNSYYNTNFFCEKILKKIQMKKIKSNPDYHLSGAMIILEDYELRFHPKP